MTVAEPASDGPVDVPAGALGGDVADDAPVESALSRRRFWRRRWVQAVAALAVVLFGYYAITLYQVHSTGTSDQARPVDAIVVMGAAQYDGRPSAQLAARLDHVIELWDRGLAPLVITTGGKQEGDRFTEAEASARYLEEHGVPADAILEEGTSHNSYDSLRVAARLVREHGGSRVLLVSDPFHSLRIRLVSQELGLTAYVSPTRTSPVTGGEAFWREMKEAAGIALARVIGFRRLLSLTG